MKMNIESCGNYLVSEFLFVSMVLHVYFFQNEQIHKFNKVLSTSFLGSSKLISVLCIKNTKALESQLQKIKTFFFMSFFLLK